MIVFLCAHVRISISTYVLTSIVIYLPYIGLHQVTPLGVVFLFMLVNWWVEKHQRFFIQRLQTFFLNFCHVFYVFNVFLFLWNVFYIYAAHSMRNINQIVIVIKLDVRKIFPESTTPPPPWPKLLVTRILTRDMSAVAKLRYWLVSLHRCSV